MKRLLPLIPIIDWTGWTTWTALGAQCFGGVHALPTRVDIVDARPLTQPQLGAPRPKHETRSTQLEAPHSVLRTSHQAPNATRRAL